MAFQFPNNPQTGDVYEKYTYNGASWVVTGGGGGGGGDFPEAPIDDRFYVRTNQSWANQDVSLLQRYALHSDGGNFDDGFSYGAYVTLDPGDFDTGTSSGEDMTIDGGDFGE